ncbi:hypothetical protein VU01_12864, partial [Candidatus Electrothrix marina]
MPGNLRRALLLYPVHKRRSPLLPGNPEIPQRGTKSVGRAEQG